MNILFLTNKSAFQNGVFGGAESSIRLLSEHLLNNGHSVDYMTKNRTGRFWPRIMSVNRNGVKLHIFHTTYGYRRRKFVRKLNDWFLERHVRSLAKSQQIGIAYCFYETENVQLLLRVSKQLGYPKVVMRMAGIQWYEMCLRDPSLVPVYCDIFNRIDAVNYISSGLQNMVEDRLAELQMTVQFKYAFVADIGSSVRPGRTASYDSLLAEPFRVVMATRFSNYQKRHDVLVRAIAALGSAYSVCLTLIGDGGQRANIQKLVDQLGITDRVEFVPFLAQDALWSEFQASHLLCHACDHEGLGKIIIEAMAVGLPVLVSDVEPLNTYITDGENGFLVENEPEQWARKLELLMSDSSSRTLVSNKAMEWVKAYYDPVHNVNRYIEQFQQIAFRP